MAKRLFYLSLDQYALKENLQQIGFFEETSMGLTLVLECENLLPYIDSNTNNREVLRDRVISFGNRVVPSIIRFCILDNLKITLHLNFILPQTSRHINPLSSCQGQGRGKKRRNNDENISNVLVDRFSEMQNKFAMAAAAAADDDMGDDYDGNQSDGAKENWNAATGENSSNNEKQRTSPIDELTDATLNTASATTNTRSNNHDNFDDQNLNINLLSANTDLSELDYKIDFLFSENTTVQFCLLVNLLNQCIIYIDENELQKTF